MAVIVQFWDSGEPLPLLRQRMQGWVSMNSAWHYLCHDRCSAAAFLRRVYGDELAEAFLDIRLPAMMADVFRVAYLRECGGLWIDAATTCVVPLESWLPDSAQLLLLRRPHMKPPMVWNGFIFASAPRHLFLRDLWDRVSALILAREGAGVWRSFGPGLFADLLECGRKYDGVHVLATAALTHCLEVGTSSHGLPHDRHWSQRQQRESLYFSQPFVEPARRSRPAR